MLERPERWAARAVWALPVYGLLLTLGTLTHQPDVNTDFPGYARYITTPTFLASHLVASIGGAGVGVIGAVALFVIAFPYAPARAASGFILTAFAQVGLASVFGAAAFFQPAIGRAYLDGDRAVAVAVNKDVYGAALFGTAAVSVLLFIAGSILLGMAANRVPTWPRWAGITFGVSATIFAFAGFTIDIVQPIGALGVAIAGVGFAIAAQRSERVT